MPTYVLTHPLHLAKTRHERASLNSRSFSILREYNSDIQADYQSSYHFIQLCFYKLQKIEEKNLHLLRQFQQWKSNWICSIFHLFWKKYSEIYHHLFAGKILNNTKKGVKFSISDRRSSRGMESGEDMNTKCQYLSSHPCHEYFHRQIKNNIITIAHIFKTADKVVDPVQMLILSGSIGASKDADAVGRFDNLDLCIMILF